MTHSLNTAAAEIRVEEWRIDASRADFVELLYRSLDFIAAGVIPRYARGALAPELEGTTIMYKELTPVEDNKPTGQALRHDSAMRCEILGGEAPT